jgi:rubrerythrin
MTGKRKNLIKMIENLYYIEKNARDTYNIFLKEVSDFKKIEIIKEIRDDENRHMDIAKELLKIVKSK